MTRLGCAIAVTVVSAAAGSACSPDPRDLAVPAAELARAKALVRQLTSPAYDEREAAAAELARMGRLARPALATAAADPDPEVRARAARLLPRAEADELAARLDAFLADTDARFRHDVPGWVEFQKITGDTPVAREWFLDLLADEANRRLVLAVGRPDALGEPVADRRRELDLFRVSYPSRYSSAVRDPSAADVLALFFADIHLPNGPVAAAPAGFRTVGVTVGPTIAARVRIAMGEEGKGAVVRAVVARWMDTRTDATQLAAAVHLAVDVHLKEGCPAAVRLSRAGGPVADRALGVAALGQIGGPEHLPMLEVVMGLRPATPGGVAKADDQVVTQRFRRTMLESDVQMRDVALFAAVKITGQEPADYGFEEQTRYGGPRGAYSPTHYLPDGTRDAAFDKWKAWRAAHPDKPGGGSR
jgi:hypothetical protein